MKQVIPNRFLFRFAFAAGYRKPVKTAKPLGADYRLAGFSGMDGLTDFAEVRLAWHEGGITIEWIIPDKSQTIYGEEDRPNACDGMTFWIDTRDSRSSHRATRYCHQFHFLAHDGTDGGKPAVLQRPIHRALEDAPHTSLSHVDIQRWNVDADGEPSLTPQRRQPSAYCMQVTLPATAMHGYEPDANSKLGFCYRIRDKEMGDQILAAGMEFPFWEDPSLWSVLELER
ncbi:MAG TPA: hypothetical protein VNC50_20510 [Planctomycetia bacterium]|nr:hypothetical protein [Planctomycetia bacterium]